MYRALWKRVRSGAAGSRMFAASMAIILAVAMFSPVLVVYGAEGETLTPGQAPGDPAPEAPVEPAPEAPAAPGVEPAPEPAPEPTPEPAPEPAPAAPAVGGNAVQEAPAPAAAVEIAASVEPILNEDDEGPPDEGCDRIDTEELPAPDSCEDYTFGDVTVRVCLSEDGTSIDFEVLTEGYAVESVTVKGGTDSYTYFYDPPVTSDTDLISPDNEGGNTPEISHVDFCFVTVEAPETGDLEVCKFEDLDGDGVWDEGEDGLMDWEFTVYADEEGEMVLDSGMTGEDGCILFEDLPVGDVWVTETTQEGWTPTTATTQMAEITEEDTAYLEFGNMMEEEEVGDLEVCKFEDLDGDGVWDEDEEPLMDWEFTVYADEEGEMVLDSGMTGEDGCILFEDLPVGSVWVMETLQEGWENTTDLMQMTEIVEGETAYLEFGNMPVTVPPEAGDIVAIKYRDNNRNGVADAGEAFLAGWSISLYQNGVLIETKATNASGQVMFTDLVPGTYTVVETMQSGWTNVTATSRTVQVLANGTVTVYFGNIEVEQPFLPFTPSAPSEPFLPFSGGELLLLLGVGAAAGTGGVLLRRRAA